MTVFYASYDSQSDTWKYASKFALEDPIYDPVGGDPGVSYANVEEQGQKKTMFFYRTAKSFTSLRWANGWQEVAIPDNILKVADYSSVGVYDDGLARPELIAAASAQGLSIVSANMYKMPNIWNTGVYPGISLDNHPGPMVVAEDGSATYFTLDKQGIYMVREISTAPGSRKQFGIFPIYKYPFPRQKLCMLKNQDGRHEVFFTVYGDGGKNNQIQHGWQTVAGRPEDHWGNLEPLGKQYTNENRVIAGARNYLKDGKERLEIFYVGQSPDNWVYHCWQQTEGGWHGAEVFAKIDSKSVDVVLMGEYLLAVILCSDGQLMYSRQSPQGGWTKLKKIESGFVGTEASYVTVGLGPSGDPFVFAH